MAIRVGVSKCAFPPEERFVGVASSATMREPLAGSIEMPNVLAITTANDEQARHNVITVFLLIDTLLRCTQQECGD